MNKFRHAVNLSLFLFAIWLLLSGHYTVLLLAFGVVSTLFVVGVAMHAELVDREVNLVLVKPTALLYWLWLGREIIRSNIQVTRHILHPKLRISPAVVRVRASQATDLGRVTYANSITLVPGTVTMGVENDEIVAHALTHAIAADLEAGEMDRRVTQMEVSF